MSSLSEGQLAELQSHLQAAVVGAAERGLYQASKWYDIPRRYRSVPNSRLGRPSYLIPYQRLMILTRNPTHRLHHQPPNRSSPRIPNKLAWKPANTTNISSPSPSSIAENMTAALRFFSPTRNRGYRWGNLR
jgi:hypothetical protein